MQCIEQLLDSLSIGGVAALHITLERRLSSLKGAIYWAKHYLPGARIGFNLLQGKRWDEPFMQMNNYSLPDVLAIFRRKGMQDLFLQPDFCSSFGVVIYGRRGQLEGE